MKHLKLKLSYKIFKRILLILLIVSIYYFYGINNGTKETKKTKETLDSDLNKEEHLKILINQNLDVDMENVARRMEERRKHLNNNCHTLGLDVIDKDHEPNSENFFVNDKHKLIWCIVFKAAASSWMQNFNLLGGFDPEYLDATLEIPIVMAQKIYPIVSIKELNDLNKKYTSFIIVRHPFERILSTYLDTYYMIGPASINFGNGQRLIHRYRRNAKKYYKLNRPIYPKFKEYIKYLIDLVKKDLYEIQWAPINTFCIPCLVQFDYILKLDTFQEDEYFLINKTNITDIVEPIKLNMGKYDTNKYIEKFYSRLKKEKIQELYEIFKYDFQIFNYSITDYLNMAKP